MKNVWFVSRQNYYGLSEDEGQYMVEVAYGGLDYANADMYAPKYNGEAKEYSDPREAVRVAIAISEAWKKDSPHLAEYIEVGYGYTAGNSMPFEGSSYEVAMSWAEQTYRELEKCDRCGYVVDEREHYTLQHHEGKFCSEDCADWMNAHIEIDQLLNYLDDFTTSEDDIYFSSDGEMFVSPTVDAIERMRLDGPETPHEARVRLKRQWGYK